MLEKRLEHLAAHLKRIRSDRGSEPRNDIVRLSRKLA